MDTSSDEEPPPPTDSDSDSEPAPPSDSSSSDDDSPPPSDPSSSSDDDSPPPSDPSSSDDDSPPPSDSSEAEEEGHRRQERPPALPPKPKALPRGPKAKASSLTKASKASKASSSKASKASRLNKKSKESKEREREEDEEDEPLRLLLSAVYREADDGGDGLVPRAALLAAADDDDGMLARTMPTSAAAVRGALELADFPEDLVTEAQFTAVCLSALRSSSVSRSGSATRRLLAGAGERGDSRGKQRRPRSRQRSEGGQQPVTLDVGGRAFRCLPQIFTRYPDSTLGRLLLQRGKRRVFFFDRNPRYFEPVLEWFRGGVLRLDPGVSAEAVEDEARFFGVWEEMFGRIHRIKQREEENARRAAAAAALRQKSPSPPPRRRSSSSPSPSPSSSSSQKAPAPAPAPAPALAKPKASSPMKGPSLGGPPGPPGPPGPQRDEGSEKTFQKAVTRHIAKGGRPVVFALREHEQLQLNTVQGAGRLIMVVLNEDGAVCVPAAVVFDSNAYFFMEGGPVHLRLSLPGGLTYSFHVEAGTGVDVVFSVLYAFSANDAMGGPGADLRVAVPSPPSLPPSMPPSSLPRAQPQPPLAAVSSPYGGTYPGAQWSPAAASQSLRVRAEEVTFQQLLQQRERERFAPAAPPPAVEDRQRRGGAAAAASPVPNASPVHFHSQAPSPAAGKEPWQRPNWGPPQHLKQRRWQEQSQAKQRINRREAGKPRYGAL